MAATRPTSSSCIPTTSTSTSSGTSTSTMSSLAQSPPPLAHAIGGSLGSALALMLLYPLERAKIEMQAQASQRRSSRHRSHLPSPLHVESNINKAIAVETALLDSPTTSDTDTSYVMVSSTDDHLSELADSDKQKPPLTVQLNVSDHSQVHIQPPPPPESISTGVAVSPIATKQVDLSTPSAGLISCMVKLWERGELYRGIAPVVSTIGISNFIFFYVNEFMKKLFFPELSTHSKQQKLTLSLLASSLAGVANVILTNPLWVANLRVISGGRKLQHSSVWLEMIRIAREEGLLQLWNGTLASLLLISNPVIQFFCYDLLKNGRITQKKNRLLVLSMAAATDSKMITAAGRLSPGEAFLLGAIAKAISTILTYPLQLAQAVLRLQQKPDNGPATPTGSRELEEGRIEYHGTFDCLCKLYHSGGLEGLFTGIKAKLLQTVLTAAFTFLTYEQIVQAIQVALLRP